jgi:hypothetical protein
MGRAIRPPQTPRFSLQNMAVARPLQHRRVLRRKPRGLGSGVVSYSEFRKAIRFC